MQAVTVSQAAQLEYATAKATPQQVCSRLSPAMLCAHLNLQELLRIWCGHRSEFIVRVQDTSNALKGGKALSTKVKVAGNLKNMGGSELLSSHSGAQPHTQYPSLLVDGSAVCSLT